jgi:hypothetical protein
MTKDKVDRKTKQTQHIVKTCPTWLWHDGTWFLACLEEEEAVHRIGFLFDACRDRSDGTFWLSFYGH